MTEPLLTSTVITLATDWIPKLLANWAKSRTESKKEEAAWQEVANQILKQTITQSENQQIVTTIAFPKEPVLLRSIYEPLTLEKSVGRDAYRIDSFPKKLFLSARKVLVVDSAGMGKSTISKIMFQQSLSERISLPILLDLRRFTSAKSIESILSEKFGIKNSHEELFCDFLRTQQLTFFLDGFDEIPEGLKTEGAIQIRDFADRASSSYFFMTSRPDSNFGSYADFSVFSIRELKTDESHKIIRKYGDAYNVRPAAEALISELAKINSGAVQSFLQNPLLTSLLFRSFEYKSIVPLKRGVFYRQVFDALFDSHDLSKEIGYTRPKKTNLQQDDFHRCLRAIAAQFRVKQSNEVTKDDFIAMTREISSSVCADLIFKTEDFLNDATRSIPVFVRDGNHVRWAHKSLMDYFLAEYLIRDYPKSKAAALAKMAFEKNSLANENFLTLSHESDPILFAQAVTIPAARHVLKKFKEIKSSIREAGGHDLEDCAAKVFACYEVHVAQDSDSSSFLFSEDRSIQELGIDEDSYFPYSGIYYGQGLGVITVLLEKHYSALRIPMELGILKQCEIELEDANDTPTDLALKRAVEFKFEGAIYHSFKTSQDANIIQHFTPNILQLIRRNIPVPDFNELEGEIASLEAVVSKAAAAKDVDVF